MGRDPPVEKQWYRGHLIPQDRKPKMAKFSPWKWKVISTKSSENESSNNHENSLNEVRPDDGRKATSHGEDTGNRLKKSFF